MSRIPPDRDRGDFDLIQRLLLSKPRKASLFLRLFRLVHRGMRAFWRWC